MEDNELRVGRKTKGESSGRLLVRQVNLDRTIDEETKRKMKEREKIPIDIRAPGAFVQPVLHCRVTIHSCLFTHGFFRASAYGPENKLDLTF